MTLRPSCSFASSAALARPRPALSFTAPARAVRSLSAISLAALSLAACGQPAPAPLDATPPVDAPPDPWARYTIPAGQHPAVITGGSPENPLRGVVSLDARDYQFAFNPSAQYVLTMPTQPDDQLDWNKLPGLSDCGTPDLSDNGLMFGWRWRIDLAPPVLEVTAYANNDGTHLTTPTLLSLSAADLAADVPLRYRLSITPDRYLFSITGDLPDRPLSATGDLPRACPATAPADPKWAAGFYFGGTSVSPQEITARISELPP